MTETHSDATGGRLGSGPPARSAWVDNLRTLVVILVVNMHACVTYSHVGGWYLKVVPEPGLATKAPFIFWQGHLQSFFMGLLFFLAGAFGHRSLERRGPWGFLKERVMRLGAPALFYMLVIHPFMVYVLLGLPQMPNRPSLAVLYARYFTSGRVVSGNGPMWFTLALLAFSLALVAWRAVRPAHPLAGGKAGAPPGAAALTGVAIGLGMATFLVRLVQPIGTSVLNFQLCFFPQYIAAFVAGVMAGQGGWLESLAMSQRARVAGWLGLLGGPVLLGLVLFLGMASPSARSEAFQGGWNVQALGAAMWEQLAGLCLGLGSLALFRRRFDCGGRLAHWLSERAFAVYVLHAPVLVALALLLQPVGLNPFLGAAFLTVLGLAASFPLADVARRVPGLRALL